MLLSHPAQLLYLEVTCEVLWPCTTYNRRMISRHLHKTPHCCNRPACGPKNSTKILFSFHSLRYVWPESTNREKIKTKNWLIALSACFPHRQAPLPRYGSLSQDAFCLLLT